MIQKHMIRACWVAALLATAVDRVEAVGDVRTETLPVHFTHDGFGTANYDFDLPTPIELDGVSLSAWDAILVSMTKSGGTSGARIRVNVLVYLLSEGEVVGHLGQTRFSVGASWNRIGRDVATTPYPEGSVADALRFEVTTTCDPVPDLPIVQVIVAGIHPDNIFRLHTVYGAFSQEGPHHTYLVKGIQEILCNSSCTSRWQEFELDTPVPMRDLRLVTHARFLNWAGFRAGSESQLSLDDGTYVALDDYYTPSLGEAPARGGCNSHLLLLDEATQDALEDREIVGWRWRLNNTSGYAKVTHSPGVMPLYFAYDTSEVVYPLPEACFRVEPQPPAGFAPFQVSVNAICSTPGAGDALIAYEWDFGDGGEPAQGVEASHEYTTSGRHRIRLTVTNDVEGVRPTSHFVTVNCPQGGDVSPWMATDTGAPEFSGRSWPIDEEPDCYEMCAGGTLLKGMSEEFHFLHREAEGDFSILGHVLEVTGGDGVGLMLREDYEAHSRHVTLQLPTPQDSGGRRLAVRRRSQVDRSISVNWGDEVRPPVWLRLDRRGNDVTAYYSLMESPAGDLENWTLVRSQTIDGLSETLLVGVAGTGGDAGSDTPLVPLHARIGSLELISERFLRGDCNDDGGVDITDGIATLNYLFLGSEAPPCLKSCDADDTGELQLTDAVYLLGFLFLGGPPPAAPFPDCGQDPTGGDLTCGPLVGCQ